jgi:hypothetical protein
MEYILKSATSKQVPYTNRDNVYGIDVLITTGIVGQTYDGFQNLNIGFCPIERTDNINQIQAKINLFATNFVTTKYPNT